MSGKVFTHIKETVAKTTVIETLAERGPNDPPPKVPPRLRSAPKPRQLYWCDFPKDAQLPEFWKCRAVLIVSLRSTLYSAVTVLPCSSDDQTGNKWAYKQATTIDGRADSWVICDKPTTVAVSRLSVDRTGVKFIPEREFNEVLALMYKGLPQVRGLET